MQQRNIIIFIIILFLASSLWLFHAGNNFNDSDYQKSWWALYFSDPKSDNLNFVIENHTDQTDFHYVILSDNQKIKEGDAKIKKGDSYESQVKRPTNSEKVTIQVNAGEEKKEIYKNL